MNTTVVKQKSPTAGLSKKVIATTAVISALALASNANAALQQIDVSDIVTSIGVIVAAVTSIGLGVLSVVLLTKAFRYIRAAM